MAVAALIMASSAVAGAADLRATRRAREVAEIVTYQGPDRTQRLVEGARREGRVTLYVSLNLRESQPLVEDFKGWLKQTHGLEADVNLWRAGSEDVLQRSILEARAGRFEADVYEVNAPELEILSRETVTTRFWSPYFADYPDAARDPKGFWHATRFNVFTQGYNTRLVRPDEVPKSWSDLLHPRWRGRMAIEASDWDWFATLVKRGPFGSQQEALAFFDRLREQNLQVRSGHTLMAELLAAGEFALGLTMYNHRLEEMKKDGAPVEWFVIEPAVVRANGIAVAANAPHPHLAMLFVDYILSERGQNKLFELGRVPASPRVKTDLNQGFRYLVADIDALIDEARQWEALWQQRVIRK